MIIKMQKASSEDILKFNQSILPTLEETSNVLNEFDITSVGYSRFYPNKSIRLTNNLDWMQCFVDTEVLYKERARYCRELNEARNKEFHIILRSQDAQSHYINKTMRPYDIDNICSLYIRNKGYYEMFGFASKTGAQNLSNFYIYNTSFLLKYVLYFRERMHDIINKNINNILLSFESSQENLLAFTDDSIIQLNKKIQLKKIYLTDDLFLTEKEYECLHYLCHGYTHKDIAITMKISHRTVEAHLDKIMYKMNCNCKSDILKFIKNNYLTFHVL